ncbi:MAG: PRTRC system protein E [Rhodanobacter sp.]|nr:PRTRC system protein E [Rhodanobacter sp.]
MTFLNALKPLLRGQSAVTLRLSANADGGFRLIVTPALQGIDADTDDVELAHLQALLAAPFTLTLAAEADLDQAFTEAVAQFHALREPKLNELDALRARMEAAAADAKKRADDAKAEAKAKANKGKTTPAKVPAKPQPAPPPTGDMFATLAGGAAPASDAPTSNDEAQPSQPTAGEAGNESAPDPDEAATEESLA